MLPALIADAYVAKGELVRVLPHLRLRAGGLVLLYPSSGTLARKVAAFRDVFVEMIKKKLFE